MTASGDTGVEVLELEGEGQSQSSVDGVCASTSGRSLGAVSGATLGAPPTGAGTGSAELAHRKGAELAHRKYQRNVTSSQRVQDLGMHSAAVGGDSHESQGCLLYTSDAADE